MAIFFPLSIGRDALLAHERALGVTGHNVANANTPGFSRQRVTLEAVPPAGDSLGRGVAARAVVQVVDQFLEARRLVSSSDLAGATTARDLVTQLASLFPVQDPGVGDALHDFFAAASDLAVHPQDMTVRGELLRAAETLASRLRSAHGGIAALQREVDHRIAQGARDANVLLDQIAELNREIARVEAGAVPANDFRDARREALNRLAAALHVNVVERDDGTVDVFAPSGAALVLGGTAAHLTTSAGAGMGLDGAALGTLGLTLDSGETVALTGELGGTFGALLSIRDDALPTRAADLDLIATVLRDKVNAIQTDAAGRDLDGVVGDPFFAGSGARDLSVALTDPRGIAAARSANPGDNANALVLEALGTTAHVELGGATFAERFGIFHAAIGGDSREAADRATIAETLASSLAAQRDAVSGVSLEEEFTDLIRFQRGFQAASQLIAISNALLDDLLGLVRL